MGAIKAQGTTFTFGTKVIGGLKSIGEVGGTADEIDVTTLDAVNGYKEYLQGFKDSGELAISGFLMADKNQEDLTTAYNSGTASECKILFPGGGTLTFTAWVKSVKYGPADVGNGIGFSATLRITGQVTYTASGSSSSSSN